MTPLFCYNEICKNPSLQKRKDAIVDFIVTFLFKLIQSLFVKISELEDQLERLSMKKPKNDLSSPKYQRFSVDAPPLVRQIKKLDYKELIKEHARTFGKELKPVNRRRECVLPADTCCPYCGAPLAYLYDNDGGGGQVLCKVCNNRFEVGKQLPSQAFLQCPYCGNRLSPVKQRNGFVIHKCVSPHCSFYQNALAALSAEDRKEYEAHPARFKLHYLYREFQTDFFSMDLSSMPGKNVNFKFRKFSPHILGLCLTYAVNCGLSTRMTQRVLLDVHNVLISHSMVARYIKTASAIVAPFVNDFDYNPSLQLAADETYVKIRGVKHYVWFVMDAIKKSILGYAVSNTRTLEPCMLALRRAFSHFTKFPAKALNLTVDGYSIYELARLQFRMKNMDFNLTKVIGLTNQDPVSKEYRWLKQIIERLNRTFKFSYRVTNGYGSFEGADSHVAVFVAYYNFLRPHPYSYNPGRVLNSIPALNVLPNMPAKWQKLIELSQLHLVAKQAA